MVHISKDFIFWPSPYCRSMLSMLATVITSPVASCCVAYSNIFAV